MTELSLTAAFGEYDRINPLRTGTIRPEGIDLRVLTLPPPEIFNRMCRDQEFHLSEMSMGSHCFFLGAGNSPFIGIPAFPSRAPSLSSGQDRPADNMQILREKLQADKKLAVAQYMRLTESEARTFWPIYERYQKELIKQLARLRRLIEKYAEIHKTMTNKVAKELMDEWLVKRTQGREGMDAFGPGSADNFMVTPSNLYGR